MPAVRLLDVANLAGVSVKTVSNVVHDKPYVNKETRQRVQKAIKELGYVPNVMARRLVTGKTGMIELAFPELRAPYYAELADLLSDEAKRQGYRLIIEQTRGKGEAERSVLSDRQQGLVDGIIFEPVSLNSADISLLNGDIPLVLLGEVTPPLSVDHVTIDNVSAAAAATNYLIELGCTSIGFLAAPDVSSSHTVQRRLLGYETALQESGREPDPDLYIPFFDDTAEGAERAVSAALSKGLTIDGLFCYNDLTAIGAMRALRHAGLRIPQDVSVVGWNDIIMARYSNPSLTTISPNVQELCERALSMLIERIEGYKGIGRHEKVDYKLTVRDSTRSKK